MKKTIALLKKKNPQLVRILESITDAFIATDNNGRCIYANGPAEKLLLKKRLQLLGKTIYQVFPQEKEYPIFNEVLKARKSGKPLHSEQYSPLLKKWLQLRIYPSEQGAMIFLSDVTTRRQERTDRLHLATLVDSIGDAVISTDEQFRILSWNKAAEKLYRWKAKEVLGRQVGDVIGPEDGSDTSGQARLATFKETGTFSGEVVQHRKDGVRIPIHASVTAIRDEKSRVVGAVAVNRDISEMKRIQERLLESQKRKDEFIGVASHELRTPVTSIKAYTQVLMSRFRKNKDRASEELVGKMDAQLDKLTNLIADLLDVTKIEGGRLQFREEYFNMAELVSEVAEEMQRTTDRHQLVLKAKDDASLFGDRERIGQVLMNLLSNAIKYSPHTKRILITTKIAGNHVAVSVRDYGLGISKDKKDHVFDRFYRIAGPQQDTYPGLGLGLYISSEIIRRQGGKIWVESTLGKGSTFHFSLPLIEQPSA